MDIKELRGLMEAYQQVNAPEQIDEVLDTPEKANEYAKKNVKSMVGAFVKGAVNKDISQLKTIEKRKRGAELGKRKAERKAAEEQKESFDVFDIVLEFLQVEGYTETLEEAEWMMANMIDEEAIDIILGEAIYSEKGKAKAAEMIAKRSTPSGRAKSGQGSNVAQIRQIRGSGRGRFDREGLGGTPMTPTMAKNPIKKHNYDGTGNKAARRAGLTPTREKPNAWKEDFELWVNELVEEGYDLSDYTWDEMYEFYLDEDAGIVSGLAGLALGAKGASYAAKHSKRMRDYPKNFVKGMIDPRTYVPKKKQQKEAFEAWLDEAMTNYEKNRKRAAQRAAARNDARAQGKTGAVPGVGYVTPRKERETWTDESGKTRHAKGL